MSSSSIESIALIGNPNAGKSSVFNRLTGLNHKIGNFPGVTVDKKIGTTTLPNGKKLKVIDLPGTYSLHPNSMDEEIVLDILLDPENKDKPDALLYIADTSNLERHLLLLSQILDLNIPVILGLNMLDIAEKDGLTIDIIKLSNAFHLPVFEINGRTGKGITELKDYLAHESLSNPTDFYDIFSLAPELIKDIKSIIPVDNDFEALLIAHHHARINHYHSNSADIEKLLSKHKFNGTRMQVDEVMGRFDQIQQFLSAALRENIKKENESFTDKIDRFLTHKVFGSIIYFGVLFVIFQAIFAWAEYPMDLIDEGVSWLNSWLKSTLPSGFITDLLTDGIISGLGGIIIFIPQISILFAFVAFMEEVGYMARAVMLSDNLMRKFGLNGRSMVALVSGVACAIPAIMSTRTISSWKERLITVFVTPFISCSARIPVFTVLISFIVPEEYYFGLFNLQGLVMMAMYLLGLIAALFSAFVLKKVLKSKEISFLMLELPVYQWPDWNNMLTTLLSKVRIFVFSAGKIILVISIILWALASYGPGDSMNEAVQSIQEEQIQTINPGEVNALIAAKKIEASYAGHFGKFIEPVIKPLGFDWKIGIALLTSFAAREVFVGTMATIYSVGSDEEKPIIERMKAEINPDTGEPLYNVATALSLLVFYVFALQCMSTLAVVKRETNSWLIPILQLVYMTGLAYVCSLLAYNIFR